MLKSVEKAVVRHRPNMDRIMENTEKLRRALEWCALQGLDAYSADVTHSRPQILVEVSGRCAELVKKGLGAEIGSQSSGGVHSRVFCVIAEDCQIMWVERGN